MLDQEWSRTFGCPIYCDLTLTASLQRFGQYCPLLWLLWFARKLSVHPLYISIFTLPGKIQKPNIIYFHVLFSICAGSSSWLDETCWVHIWALLAVSPKSPEHPCSLHTGMQQHPGSRHVQEGRWAGVFSQSRKNEEDWSCWQTPIYISNNVKKWFWDVASHN